MAMFENLSGHLINSLINFNECGIFKTQGEEQGKIIAIMPP